MQTGDLVRIKYQFLDDPAERDLVYVVVSTDRNRIEIAERDALEKSPTRALVPVESVTEDMVEKL